MPPSRNSHPLPSSTSYISCSLFSSSLYLSDFLKYWNFASKILATSWLIRGADYLSQMDPSSFILITFLSRNSAFSLMSSLGIPLMLLIYCKESLRVDVFLSFMNTSNSMISSSSKMGFFLCRITSTLAYYSYTCF